MIKLIIYTVEAEKHHDNWKTDTASADKAEATDMLSVSDTEEPINLFDRLTSSVSDTEQMHKQTTYQQSQCGLLSISSSIWVKTFQKATGCSADAVQISDTAPDCQTGVVVLELSNKLRIETTFLFTTVLTTAERCGFTITTLQRKVWMSSLRTHNWTRCTVIWVSRTQINDLISCMRFHMTSVKHQRSRNEPHRPLRLSLLMMGNWLWICYTVSKHYRHTSLSTESQTFWWWHGICLNSPL
jgi:hypothetical protein